MATQRPKIVEPRLDLKLFRLQPIKAIDRLYEDMRRVAPPTLLYQRLLAELAAQKKMLAE